jgi:anti-anti-sigma regulatory factor
MSDWPTQSENFSVFRITHSSISPTDQFVVLQVEGRLGAECIDDFIRACEPHLNSAKRAQFDLAGVTFMDQAAAAAIQRFSEKMNIRAASPFVRAVLKEQQS